MYISVPIGENAFYEKNKTRGVRRGTPVASSLPITTMPRGDLNPCPALLKIVQTFCQRQEKNKSVEHVCEKKFYEKIRKHDCDNIFVSASYYFPIFSPQTLIFPNFSPPIFVKNKNLIIKAIANVFCSIRHTFQKTKNYT